jgi:hypothetical protein
LIGGSLAISFLLQFKEPPASCQRDQHGSDAPYAAWLQIRARLRLSGNARMALEFRP